MYWISKVISICNMTKIFFFSARCRYLRMLPPFLHFFLIVTELIPSNKGNRTHTTAVIIHKNAVHSHYVYLFFNVWMGSFWSFGITAERQDTYISLNSLTVYPNSLQVCPCRNTCTHSKWKQTFQIRISQCLCHGFIVMETRPNRDSLPSRTTTLYMSIPRPAEMVFWQG